MLPSGRPMKAIEAGRVEDLSLKMIDDKKIKIFFPTNAFFNNSRGLFYHWLNGKATLDLAMPALMTFVPS
jgi:hypothetical protein